jgi:purine nucleosidase
MKSVIINCDPGIDDALAIMLAIKSKRLDIAGITTSFGNTSVQRTTDNALALLDYLGVKIPVAQGAGKPVIGKRIKANYVHGENGFANIVLPKKSMSVPENADDFIIKNVESGRVDTLISTGPLTNIITAFKKKPDIMHRVKDLIIMGAAITEPGSVTRVAEFNFYCDPYAADEILHTSVKKTLISRDVTQRVILKPTDLQRFGDGKVAKLAVKLIRFYQKFYVNVLKLEGNPLPDALTVGYAINKDFIETKDMDVVVETEGIHTHGMSIAERREGKFQEEAKLNAAVSVKVNAKEFIDYFIETLSSKD